MCVLKSASSFREMVSASKPACRKPMDWLITRNCSTAHRRVGREFADSRATTERGQMMPTIPGEGLDPVEPQGAKPCHVTYEVNH